MFLNMNKSPSFFLNPGLSAYQNDQGKYFSILYSYDDDDDDDDDVYLGYYSGKMVSYKLPCLHVLR
jgi:hypothetical protein